MAVAALVLLSGAPAAAAPLAFSVSGANPAAIQPTVDAFRASIGALNANAPGSFGGGRREINWDGVSDVFSAPNSLPANFFNANSPRGAILSGPGTGFAASGTPVRFGNINATYTAEFQTFSPQRLFTSIGSNVYDVTFFIPGTPIHALVQAFGAIFTDVEIAGSTKIEYFDANNLLLDIATVATGSAGGLSFAGLNYGSPAVSRVRVTAGNAALGSAQSGNDLVAVDDFIYGEPVPEPASFLALTMGLMGVAAVRRRPRG